MAGRDVIWGLEEDKRRIHGEMQVMQERISKYAEIHALDIKDATTKDQVAGYFFRCSLRTLLAPVLLYGLHSSRGINRPSLQLGVHPPALSTFIALACSEDGETDSQRACRPSRCKRRRFQGCERPLSAMLATPHTRVEAAPQSRFSQGRSGWRVRKSRRLRLQSEGIT